MNIWLRELGCDGYVQRHVDSLDGLKYDETGDDGIPMYYELPHDYDAKYDDGTSGGRERGPHQEQHQHPHG